MMIPNKRTIIAFFMLLTVSLVNAQNSTRVKQFNIEKGLALQGYDPVAYFTQNKAVKGDKQFAVNAEGVTYYLSSTENKNLFIKDFKKYENVEVNNFINVDIYRLCLPAFN